MKNIKKFNEMRKTGKFSGSKDEITKHILSNYPDDESTRKTGNFSGSKDEITKHILSNYPDDKSPVKVKHLIEYLQQFGEETSVELDKDGWDSKDPMEAIEFSGLFQKFRDTLFINN